MSRLPLLYILLAALWLPLIWSPPSSAGSSEYDDFFRHSTQRYLQPLTDGDYVWLHSLCWVESNLNPLAVSPAGARGICQFMPLTWQEVTRQMGLNASIYDPRANILAAGFYLRRLSRSYTVPRTPAELRRWTFGSYNCGLGCVLRAQRRAGGSSLWRDVSPLLPTETQDYVVRIEWHFRRH